MNLQNMYTEKHKSVMQEKKVIVRLQNVSLLIIGTPIMFLILSVGVMS